MLDEIHLKPFLDYKGGSLVGFSHNNHDATTSAHVFMIQSILSPFKDVVHVLPVKTITAETLHKFKKKIIMGLEKIGYNVVGVVTDNNAINRKCISYFTSPSKLSIVYPNPAYSSQSIFFIVDPVHTFKCITNN